MKTMLKIIILALTILTLTSCSAKKTGSQKFSFKIAAIQTGLSLNGGSFVRAINESSNSLIKLDANDSAEFEQGIWEFQTVSFEGPSPYAGRRFCGRAIGVNINDIQKNINLAITEAKCYSEPFVSLMTMINTTFNNGNFLTILDISHKGGPVAGGLNVAILGSGFLIGATVSIGGSPCSGLTVVNSSTLNCTIPSHAVGPVTVTVTNPDLQSTSAANFFTYRLPPMINNLMPAMGAVDGGNNITLTGTDFVAGATIMIGSAPCMAPIVTSSTSLTCTTSSFPAGTANVVVTNPDGQMSSPVVFTYMPRPIISNITPNNAPATGGTVVIIEGAGLENVQTVSFDGVLCINLTQGSSVSFTCQTPPHASGPSVITIMSIDGQSSTYSNGFAFNPPPVLSSLSHNSGALSGGSLITINGTGFINGVTVSFDGMSCGSVNFINPNMLTCVTPAHSSGPKTVTVTNPDMQSSSMPGMYTYRESFVSTWMLANSGESITLPLVSGSNYDFWVDWGDSSAKERITSFSSPLKTHIYASPGNYTVIINGLVEGWSFGNTGSNLKITSVNNFGDMGWKNLNLAFYGCTNLTSFSGGVTTNVTNMSGMFKNANNLTNLNLSSFNTSNVTNMTYMFNGLSSLTALNIANFNTSKVTNMSYMFNEASALTSLDVSLFDTSNVINMNRMFYGTTSLINLNVNNFNTAKVTNMAFMFGHTNVLTALNLSSFNTSMVTDMTNMFEQAMALTTLDLSNFNTTNVISMANMFNNAAALTSLNISSFNTSNVTNMFQLFANMRAIPSLSLTNFDTSNVTNMQGMFYGDDDLAYLDLSNFNTSLVTNMSSMFNGTTSLGSLNVTNWSLGSVITSNDVFTNKNPSLVVTCNQAGTPASGTFFTEPCN